VRLQTGERFTRGGFRLVVEPAVLCAKCQRRRDPSATGGVRRERGFIGKDAPQAVGTLQGDGPLREALQINDEVRDGVAVLRHGQRAREAEDLPGDAARPIAVAALAVVIVTVRRSG